MAWLGSAEYLGFSHLNRIDAHPDLSAALDGIADEDRQHLDQQEGDEGEVPAQLAAQQAHLVAEDTDEVGALPLYMRK